MTITYLCGNCNKKFKVREYNRLEMTYISDDRCTEVLVPQGRKCDSCGSEIKINDKIVEI